MSNSTDNDPQFEIDYLKLLLINEVRGKVISALLKYSRHHPIVHHTQQQLALEVGAARESVSRVIGDLKIEGMLKRDEKGIHILDRDALIQELDDVVMEWFTRVPARVMDTTMLDSVTRAMEALSGESTLRDAA